MKLEITLKVEDTDENIVYSAHEALMALVYNYTNWGSAYHLRKWRNDLRGNNLRRAIHSDGHASWTSRAIITEA